MSSKQIQREIGVTYKTAWNMAKRIRKAMKHDVFEDRLGGIIEVYYAVVRASGDGIPRSPTTFEGKNVLGMVERGGSLRMMILDGLKARDIKRVVAKNFGEVQEIYSDAAKALFFLHEFGSHKSVVHIHNEYAVDEVHVNTIENAWSLFKRGLIGMYHHVSAKYLQEYLDEFAFRAHPEFAYLGARMWTRPTFSRYKDRLIDKMEVKPCPHQYCTTHLGYAAISTRQPNISREGQRFVFGTITSGCDVRSVTLGG